MLCFNLRSCVLVFWLTILVACEPAIVPGKKYEPPIVAQDEQPPEASDSLWYNPAASDTGGTDTGMASGGMASGGSTDSSSGGGYVPGQATLVGKSFENRSIYSYRFGQGDTRIVLVGGHHGGYEWRSIALSCQMMDYLLANPNAIPANVTIDVIASANPDGQYLVVGKEGCFTPAEMPATTVEARRPGRFNGRPVSWTHADLGGRGVDLNRNWDCNWSTNATWGNYDVSGGSAAFSESENVALRDFIMNGNRAEFTLWWHHSVTGGAVFAGVNCANTTVDSASLTVANVFSAAATAVAGGYTVKGTDTFGYSITGDASDWLSTQGVPSIVVELAPGESTDFAQNIAGILAILGQYAE